MKQDHDYRLDEIKSQAEKSPSYQFATLGVSSTGYIYDPSTGQIVNTVGGGGSGDGNGNIISDSGW